MSRMYVGATSVTLTHVQEESIPVYEGQRELLPDNDGNYVEYTSGPEWEVVHVRGVVDAKSDASQLILWQTLKNENIAYEYDDGTVELGWRIRPNPPRAAIIREGFNENLRVEFDLERAL